MLSQVNTIEFETSPSELSIPDLSIILVCWNNKDYLEACLESLYEGGLKSSFDVIVVDNGSTDGSQQMLREKFADVMILQNDRNVGLGRASNQGIEVTHGRYVLLLNNDTLVNGPSLDAMVEFLDDIPRAGAVGGRMLNPDGSFQAADGRFPSLFGEFLIASRLGARIWQNYPDHSYVDHIKPVDWLGSACLLLRRDALTKVGLLDEEYFIYGDETDLQYRLQVAGWLVYFLPHVTTIHYSGRSMDRWRRRKMVYRGKMLFFQKNFGPRRTMLLRLMLACLSLAKLLGWGMAYILPQRRDRAKKELQSNVEVIRICLSLS